MNYQDYGNGMRTAFDYNERGMARVVHSYHVPSGGNYSHRTYGRDERDRITAWQKSGGNNINPMEDGRGDRYGYDFEGQLTSAWYQAQNPFGTPTDPRRSDSFAYDALGNRYGTNTVASRGAVNFSRRDNGLNQYSSWSPSVINYEGNGVLIQEGMISSDFNALNQPNWMWANGMSAVMRFGYDPLGRCVKRWFGADDPAVNPATYFYYDGWNLIQEGGGPWAPSRLYAHGNRVDEAVVSFRNSTAEHGFHHYDARGHTILVTAGNANLMEQYDYDAFGKPYFYSAGGAQLPDSPFGNRILFTGREWLKELGIYDFRNRHYQPELGRFLQPEPKQFDAGDYNLYRYCHNDPINKSDPFGLIEESGTWNSETMGLGIEMSQGYLIATGVVATPMVIAAGAEAGSIVLAARAALLVRAAVPLTTAAKLTQHGAERVEGAAATRGGVLSQSAARLVQETGTRLTQADGAAVHVAKPKLAGITSWLVASAESSQLSRT